MNTTQITGVEGATMADVAIPGPCLSRDLARAQGTDFFAMDGLLTEPERAIRDRVRAFVDDKLIPVANEYWERAEFPAALVPAYAGLRVAGGAIQDYGCPGMSPVAEGLVALELARGDGSFSTFNSVHSGRVSLPVTSHPSERPAPGHGPAGLRWVSRPSRAAFPWWPPNVD